MALRSNELMIGDWVYKDNTPVQILALNLFVGKEHEDIKPIPITTALTAPAPVHRESQRLTPISNSHEQTCRRKSIRGLSFGLWRLLWAKECLQRGLRASRERNDREGGCVACY